MSKYLVLFCIVLVHTCQCMQLTIRNNCDKRHDITLTKHQVHPTTLANLGPYESKVIKFHEEIKAGLIRSGKSQQATLAEFNYLPHTKKVWYDISIIPDTCSRSCRSLQCCKDQSQGRNSFNVPMQMAPSDTSGDNCKKVTCLADGCEEAYKFPNDDLHTHTCTNVDMTITFCPGNKKPATPKPSEKDEIGHDEERATSKPATDKPTDASNSETLNSIASSGSGSDSLRKVEDSASASGKSMGSDASDAKGNASSSKSETSSSSKPASSSSDGVLLGASSSLVMFCMGVQYLAY